MNTEDLREYLIANVFDGEITDDESYRLDEITKAVEYFLDEQPAPKWGCLCSAQFYSQKNLMYHINRQVTHGYA